MQIFSLHERVTNVDQHRLLDSIPAQFNPDSTLSAVVSLEALHVCNATARRQGQPLFDGDLIEASDAQNEISENRFSSKLKRRRRRERTADMLFCTCKR